MPYKSQYHQCRDMNEILYLMLLKLLITLLDNYEILNIMVLNTILLRLFEMSTKIMYENDQILR